MYKERVWFTNGTPDVSEVSFQLLARDWSKLQETREWHAFEEQLQALQKEYIHSLPLVREYKLGAAVSTNAKKKLRCRLRDLFRRE